MSAEVTNDPAAMVVALTTGDDDTNTSYIQTTTHNYISRQAIVIGAKQVEIKGRTIVEQNSQICGNDTTWIRIGRYSHIQSGTTIEPPTVVLLPTSSSKGNNDNNDTTTSKKYIPVQIGSHTIIGKNCLVNAAAIGSYCLVGDNVTIGPRCIIKDCCIIDANTFIPPDTVIPPFTRVMMAASSNNNTIYRRLLFSELPPSISIRLQEQTMEYYQEFSSNQRKMQLLLQQKK